MRCVPLSKIRLYLSNTPVFQVALGGCGDPDMHPEFESLLRKPVGLGVPEQMLRVNDHRLDTLFDLIDGGGFPFQIGFDNQKKQYAVDLRRAGAIQAAWDSEEFEQFRKRFFLRCNGCRRYAQCLGDCPLMEEIVLCNAPERNEGRLKPQ